MTTQFKDSVILKKSKNEDEVYQLIEVKEGSLFNPDDYGFIPSSTCYISACLKGFLANYIISESDIRLKDLYINATTDNKITLNGVEPKLNDRRDFKADTFEEFKKIIFKISYENLDLKLTNFTGSLLLGIEGKFNDESSVAIAKTLPYGEDCYGNFISVEIINGNVTKINKL